MKFIILFLFSLLSISIYAQQKQANTAGSELIADAPLRIKKFNPQGNLNGIPVFIYIHDGNDGSSQNDVIDVKISIKNADTSIFNAPLTVQNYTDSAFQKLISCRSVSNSYFDIQHFDSSGAVKDSLVTMHFTKDTNWWIPPIPLVYVTKTHWYFMFTIPPEKLAGFNDIIDISIEFNLDYDINETKYMRVFRYTDSLPTLLNWYKGDTHFHGFNTQNNAELGFPLDASRVAAKVAGLEWITVTDHSCDFDNYGTSMFLNWQKLGEQIQSLNSNDPEFKYIRGIEMSIDNSNGNVVHALVYPSPEYPFNLTYLGDGGGDLSGTDITVNDVLSSLSQSGGFAYAAHPFAEGDKLSSMVNGGVWNVNDMHFPLNDSLFPSGGIVGCNNTNNVSDIFSIDSNSIFKNCLAGGQIMNLRNIIQSTDEAYNPWNVNYSSVDPFTILDSLDPLHFYTRFKQNLDVTEFLWKKSLFMKNHNQSLQNWKFYISAGSDSHGSFNYANTDFTMEITGNVNDNAIGKLFTMAYCPAGMGANGKNILHALKNGHTVLSDGPVLSLSITNDNISLHDDIIVGDDTVLNIDQLHENYLVIKAKTTEIYGHFNFIKLHAYTQDSSYTLNLPVNSETQIIPLQQILSDLFISIPESNYFMLTAELETVKNYGAFTDFYKIQKEKFHCLTNPIYLKIINNVSARNIKNPGIKIYPNPAKNELKVATEQVLNNTILSICSVTGQVLITQKADGLLTTINISTLESGIYFIKFFDHDFTTTKMFVKE